MWMKIQEGLFQFHAHTGMNGNQEDRKLQLQPRYLEKFKLKLKLDHSLFKTLGIGTHHPYTILMIMIGWQ
jgi:hypothetical protein